MFQAGQAGKSLMLKRNQDSHSRERSFIWYENNFDDVDVYTMVGYILYVCMTGKIDLSTKAELSAEGAKQVHYELYSRGMSSCEKWWL